MALKKFVCIIPARYASTRFPGKPLAMIGGKTMIRRVYEQALKVLPDVVVATDDERIQREVESFGGVAVMTSDLHRSGTDRCYEALGKLTDEYDVIINIQGDEPFIQPQQIVQLMNCFDDDQVQIATLARKVLPSDGQNFLFDVNRPKVVLNVRNEALYFSRNVIPHLRSVPAESYPAHHEFFTHVGIYAYQKAVLKKIVSLPASKNEIAESLEQLRWLDHGYRIQVALTAVLSHGIDTAQDLIDAEKYYQENQDLWL
jgi:3-deoxy-manno-octulosonate cytidylyltransferase (CMP-KDO synthetase)